MNILKQTAIALTLSMIAVVPAFAGQTDSHTGKHTGPLAQVEQHQQQRIKQGVKEKSLTRKEAKFLEKEQRETRQLARLFYEDGHLSKHERQILAQRMHQSDRHIRTLKHNELNRYVNWHDAYGHRDHCRL